MIGYWYQVIEAWYSYLGLLGILERRVGFFELDYRDSRDSGDSDSWSYGVNLSHLLVIWNRGVGVPVMWSPGIVGDSVVAVAVPPVQPQQCRRKQNSTIIATLTPICNQSHASKSEPHHRAKNIRAKFELLCLDVLQS